MVEEICTQINEALRKGIRNKDLRLFVTHDVYEALRKELADRAVFCGNFPPCWLELYRQYKGRWPGIYTIYGIQICPAQWGTGWTLAETQGATVKPRRRAQHYEEYVKVVKPLLDLTGGVIAGGFDADGEEFVMAWQDSDPMVVYKKDSVGLWVSKTGRHGPWKPFP